jgi:hypothetical protein
VRLRVEMEGTIVGSRGPKLRGHAAPNLKIISNKLSSLLSISNFSLQTVQSTVQNNTLHDRLHDLL